MPKICSFNVNISQVSCGHDHSCFIASPGHIYSMGSNSYGKLGTGDNTMHNSTVPVLVESLSDLRMVKVECGKNHTVAISD